MANKFSIKIGGVVDTKNIISQIDSALNKHSFKINIDKAYLKGQLDSVLTSKSTSLSGGASSGAVSNSVSEIKDLGDSFGTLTQRVTNAKGVITDTYKKLDVGYDTITKVANATGTVTKETLNFESANTRLNKGILSNENLYGKLSSKISGMSNTLGVSKKNIEGFKSQLDNISKTMGVKTPESIEQTTKSLNQLQNEIGAVESRSRSGFQTLSSAVGKFTAWYLIAGVVSSMVRQLKDVVVQVKALDHALVELNKVADVSDYTLKAVTDRAFALGKEVGKTGTQVINAITEFKRDGYTLGQSEELAKYALIMTNVADGITNTGESANYLVSILKGANLDISYATKILDEMNEISNNSAISFDKLASMTQRIAGTMRTLGVNIEQTQALLTGAFEVLQDERVAKGISVIGLRIQGLNEDLEAEAGLQSRVGKAFEKYANIDIFDKQTGQLRNYYDILKELAGVWETLDKNTQTYLLTETAGKHRADVLAALMQNWSGVESAMSYALNSSGSALQEQERYLDSIEGKLAKLENAWQELATSTLSSDLVGFLIQVMTALAQIQTYLGGLVPLMTTIMGIFITIKSYKTIGYLKTAVGQVVQLGKTFQTLTAEMQATAVASAKLQATLGWITLGLSAIWIVTSAVKSGIEATQKRQEEYRKSVQENAEKEIDALGKVQKEYKRLAEISSPTVEQQKELEDILNALGIAYDKASLGAEKYADKIEEVNKATKKGIIQNYQKTIEANRSAYEEAQKKMQKESFTSSEKIKLGNLGQDEAAFLEEASKVGIGVSLASGGLFSNVKRKTIVSGTYAQQKKELESYVSHYEKLMTERAIIGQSLSKSENLVYMSVVDMLSKLEEKYKSEINVVSVFENAQKALQDVLNGTADSLEDTTDSIDKQAEAIRRLKDSFSDLQADLSTLLEAKKLENKELERENKLREKSLDIEKARIALEEARNRKVRVYRSGVGFTYMSDTSGVQSAQEALITAQKAKMDYERNVALEIAEEFVKELSGIIESDDINSAWQSFFDRFSSLLGTEYEDLLTQAHTFVEAYKNAMKQIDNTNTSHELSYFEQAKQYILKHGLEQGDKNRWMEDRAFREIAENLTGEEWSQLKGYTRGAAKYRDGRYIGYEKIAPKYHSGGIVGQGAFRNDNEMEATLLKNEIVLQPTQLDSLLSKSFASGISQVGGNVYNIGTVEMSGVQDVDGFVRELTLVASR